MSTVFRMVLGASGQITGVAASLAERLVGSDAEVDHWSTRTDAPTARPLAAVESAR
jgi:hypothetical protein